MKTARHYTPSYLRTPTHPVTIHVIGCGGTGSNVLRELAKLHLTLLELDHAGIHVVAFDSDTVEQPNIGRQFFYPSDIGQHKCKILISRINQSCGTDWEARPVKYTCDTLNTESAANLTISCVDTVSAREQIGQALSGVSFSDHGRMSSRPFYWLDYGNSKESGQVVLGTIGEIEQPKSKFDTKSVLPNVLEMFPQMKEQEKGDDSPSCSSADALRKQDLFVNSFITIFGMELIWSLFRSPFIENHGAFANIGSLKSQPIKVA